MKLLKYLCLLSISSVAQPAVHSITFTWLDPNNPAGTTYNLYQTTGLCPAVGTATKVATGITTKTFTLTPVAQGTYCFYVTAVNSGVESGPSPTNQDVIGPFSPTTLNSVIQ